MLRPCLPKGRTAPTPDSACEPASHSVGKRARRYYNIQRVELHGYLSAFRLVFPTRGTRCSPQRNSIPIADVTAAYPACGCRSHGAAHPRREGAVPKVCRSNSEATALKPSRYRRYGNGSPGGSVTPDCIYQLSTRCRGTTPGA